ncbi:MAG: hypothetical protein P4M15_05740 [Alphaproteobacteria bacterium]|nr:hypothetical protein [Alphaproteobacteria bacterium]
MPIFENEWMSLRRYKMESEGIARRNAENGEMDYDQKHLAFVTLEVGGKERAMVWEGGDEYSAWHGAFANALKPELGRLAELPVYAGGASHEERLGHVFSHFACLMDNAHGIGALFGTTGRQTNRPATTIQRTPVCPAADHRMTAEGLVFDS